MKLKLLSVLFILFILALSCKEDAPNYAENRDALSPKDSIKLELIINHLTENYFENKDSLIQFSDSILSVFKTQEKLINIRIAHIHFSHSNYFLAQQYFNNAAQLYLVDSLIEKHAEQITNIGVTKEVSGNYTGAIEDYFFALNIFDSLDIPFKKSYIYNNIGIVYQQLNNGNKAIEYYRKSLEIAQELKLETLSANRYNNIATLFEDEFNNLDSALYYYKKAHSIYSNDTTSAQLPLIENNIGYIYLRKQQFSKADSIFNKALKFSLEHNISNITSSIIRNQAQLLIYQNKLEEAETKALEAVAVAQSNGFAEMEIKALKVLAELYEKKKDFRKTNLTIRTYYKLQDKLSGIEQKKQINSLNIQYQVKEKEHQIQVLELNNDVQNRKLWQLWLLIAALSFLLSGLFFIFRLQRKNNRLHIRQMQIDISDYISQLEEIKEDQEKVKEHLHQQKTTKEELNKQNILSKIKQFDLTEREEDVLLLISKGYKNAEIADKLFLSINTIKTHTKNIFIKLDVRNRIEASRKTQII